MRHPAAELLAGVDRQRLARMARRADRRMLERDARKDPDGRHPHRRSRRDGARRKGGSRQRAADAGLYARRHGGAGRVVRPADRRAVAGTAARGAPNPGSQYTGEDGLLRQRAPGKLLRPLVRCFARPLPGYARGLHARLHHPAGERQPLRSALAHADGGQRARHPDRGRQPPEHVGMGLHAGGARQGTPRHRSGAASGCPDGQHRLRTGRGRGNRYLEPECAPLRAVPPAGKTLCL